MVTTKGSGGMRKVTITIKGLSDQAFNMQRHADVDHVGAKKLYQEASTALVNLFNWHVKHGAPMEAEITATDHYII